MREPRKLPGLESFRATLKKGNMPDDYPPEPLAQLALDMRAAEAFVKTPEGARSLNLFVIDPTGSHFKADDVWATMTFEQRLALAKLVGRYRRDTEQDALLQEPEEEDEGPPEPAASMPKKMRKLLKVVYELAGGRTNELVTANETLFEAMRKAGLEPDEADSLLERMKGTGWIEKKYLDGRFSLTPSGAEEIEGGAAVYMPSP